MIGYSNRMLAVVLAAALMAAASNVSAEETPEGQDVAEEDAVEAADDEAAAEVADDEAADDAADWETPLRNPITPTINREGAMGFHGIASAISPGPLNFQVALLGDATGGNSYIRLNDQHRMLAGNVVVNASFLDYFAAHVGIQARNSLNTYGRPQAMLAQGDTNFGVTGRYPVSDGVWLGGDLSVFVPSAFGGVGVSVPSATVRPRLMASFDIDQMMGAQADLYVPLIAHLNLGYRIDNSEGLIPEGTRIDRVERFAYGISAYDMFEMGLGLEFPLPYTTPFLGWTLGVPLNPSGEPCAGDRALDCVEDVGAAAFPHKLTVGLKGEPVANLGLHLGIDIGLTPEQAEGLPATMPYQVHFGMSWNIDPLATRQIVEREVETEVEIEPVRGIVLGRVLDEDTGEPIEGARITYLERQLSAQLTNGDGGLFQSYPFAPGEEVQLEISHPYYEVATATWTVEEGSEEMEFYLEPIPRKVWVRGQVMLAADESEETDEDALAQPQPASGARVLLRGGDRNVLELDADSEGRFEAELGAGTVTVAAIVDGYLTTGRFFEAEADEELDVEFEMPVVENMQAQLGDTQITVSGRIHFETGGATLLERTDETLDHLAAVILENPDIQGIEIQGHTDDAGEDEELQELSQARAEAVREALIKRGVAPDHLEAEGHGASSPIMPNTSSRNRSMNRRIEFHITD